MTSLEPSGKRQGAQRHLVPVEGTDVIEKSAVVSPLRVRLLGGFGVERAGGVPVPESAWQRGSAKTLTKLLATHPRHALHRDQILDILWPDVDVESARNSFAKALHAARRAFEPGLAPRESSAYLHRKDEMLTLDSELVQVDADQFQRLAESALRLGTVSAYETALAAYGGELLPEHRYDDWTAARRELLAELNVLLLLGLAEALEKRGANSQAVDRLRAGLQQDPTREDVHRRLMHLFVKMGARGHAIRQFEICRDILRRELDMAPDHETEALYQDILADRIERSDVTRQPAAEAIAPVPPSAADVALETPLVAVETPFGDRETPFIGREPVLRLLRELVTRSQGGRGAVVLASGEAGVGKTRLVSELIDEARRRGASVIGGGPGGYASRVPYGGFAMALESYVAGRPEAERTELAFRYPVLTRLIPSLEASAPPPLLRDHRSDEVQLNLLSAIARLLSDISRAGPVVVVLDDLHESDAFGTDLFQYLASLASQRRWLLIGTFREEGAGPGGELSRLLETSTSESHWVKIELQRLARQECHQLVRTLLPGGVVEDAVLNRVYTLSLGNPLFTEELVREMQEHGELAPAGRRWRASSDLVEFRVPARVRALVEQLVAPLPENARRVLALSAVAGTQITLAQLRRAASALQPPLSETELFEALDRALGTRILVEEGDLYAFRHPLVRAALYEELSQHRRLQLNAALEGTEDPRASGSPDEDQVPPESGVRRLLSALRYGDLLPSSANRKR
jgi:DNA-binding SARP family transcriptional activator